MTTQIWTPDVNVTNVKEPLRMATVWGVCGTTYLREDYKGGWKDKKTKCENVA